jgi:lysophospholipase L1-like esterase
MTLVSCGSTAPSTATAKPKPSATSALARDYLALGESITFGYVAHPSPAPGGGDPYRNPEDFTGYPSFVGDALEMTTTNASCPGETSSSFISGSGPDAGCQSYRAAFPLHVAYAGESQLEFAKAFVNGHRLSTQLVTIQLGGNDGLLVIEHCGGIAKTSCIDPQVGPTVTTLTSNLTTIVQALRDAGYNDTIVLVNLYALNYADAYQTQLVGKINAAIASVATADHLQLADVYTAFQRAAGRVGGNTCDTGLLGAGSSDLGPCDVHPALAGQHLLATTVEAAALQSGT